jgi:hypothetical protein
MKYTAHKIRSNFLAILIGCGVITISAESGKLNDSGLNTQLLKWANKENQANVSYYQPYDPPGHFSVGANVSFQSDFGLVTLSTKQIVKKNGYNVQQLLNNKELLAEFISLGSSFIWRRRINGFSAKHNAWIAFNAQDTMLQGPNVLVQSYQCMDTIIFLQSPIKSNNYSHCNIQYDDENNTIKNFANCVSKNLNVETKKQIKLYTSNFQNYIKRCRLE